MTDSTAHVNLTDETFRIVLDKHPRPVLVYVYGAYCGPSRQMFPLIDQASDDYGEAVTVMEADIEKCPTLGREFVIKGTPTYLWIERGIPIATRIGTMTYDQLADWIEETLEQLMDRYLLLIIACIVAAALRPRYWY